MNPLRLIKSLFGDSVDRMAVVGTWRDADANAVETYTVEGSVLSKIDQRLTVPVSESGFVGTSSADVTATVHGTWTIRGRKLTVRFASVEDMTLGPVELQCDNGDFDKEFIESIASGLRDSLLRDIPEMITSGSTVVTVQSVSETTLVTRDEAGEIEERRKVV